MKNTLKKGLIAGVMLLCSANASADYYVDDLSRCLVKSSTSQDKVDLVKWMFSAMSLHPAVASVGSVESGAMDRHNKQTAELFQDLLLDSCRYEAVNVIKYKGAHALGESFAVLGEVAASELMTHPRVANGIEGIAGYMDGKRLAELVQ